MKSAFIATVLFSQLTTTDAWMLLLIWWNRGSRWMTTSWYRGLWLLVSLPYKCRPGWFIWDHLHFESKVWLRRAKTPCKRVRSLPLQNLIWTLHAAKEQREAHNNHKAGFFYYLISTKYFTDTDGWLVIGFLCVVNERRQVEVDSKWKGGGVHKEEGWGKRGDRSMLS